MTESEAWTIQFKDHPVSGRPSIRLEKGDHWVEVEGETGIERESLYQQAIIEALQMDLSHAQTPQERLTVDRQLRHAIKDKQVSELMRLEAPPTDEGGWENPIPMPSQAKAKQR